MLVWTTEIPMRAGSTADEVLALARRWLTGSPHALWTEDAIPQPDVGDLATAKRNGETVSVVRVERDGHRWAGLRYSRPEDTAEWTTEIVARQLDSDLLVSVQLHCELRAATPSTPKPKKPYIIRQLLSEIGGGNDGGVPITDIPLILKEADVDLAARIVRGEFDNHLPIIYASATWHNNPAIDASKLAQWSSGLAHVVVEPSRVFSFVLARNTGRQNVYGGALGLYWPRHAGMCAVLKPETYPSPARLATAAADLVRRALLNSRPTSDCTWDHLLEMLSGHRIAALRASGSRELESYIQAFDADIKAKDQHIERLEREAARLRIELQRAEGKAEVGRGGIIRAGQEQPYYPGEIRDAILKALVAGRGQLFENGRCQHIVDDILNANAMSQEEKDIAEEIRQVLTTCENLGREQERALEQLGFSFDRSGRHIEVVYHGDQRYKFTMPKTGSDWRGMKNQASDIVKRLFK